MTVPTTRNRTIREHKSGIMVNLPPTKVTANRREEKKTNSKKVVTRRKNEKKSQFSYNAGWHCVLREYFMDKFNIRAKRFSFILMLLLFFFRCTANTPTVLSVWFFIKNRNRGKKIWGSWIVSNIQKNTTDQQFQQSKWQHRHWPKSKANNKCDENQIKHIQFVQLKQLI